LTILATAWLLVRYSFLKSNVTVTLKLGLAVTQGGQ